MLNYDDLLVTYVTLQRLGTCKDAIEQVEG
jgi:hypothetical protein